jgi:hypothetical protein
MSAGKELRRQIQEHELPHEAFKEQLLYFSRQIADAREGLGPRMEWLVGPSRVGKSMLIESLARASPETRTGGRREVPVLWVNVLPATSPKLLPTSVLQALGINLPPRSNSSGVIFNRMVDQLRLAGTRVVMFEEASHLVEPGARMPPRAAGDWFKSLYELKISVFLFGVPRLARLFESNEQLKMRASPRREFRPYDFRVKGDQAAFAACVRTYADLFERNGWPIRVSLSELVPHCYLVCGGLVGVLSRFMQELARLISYEPPRPLTWEDCSIASKNVHAAGHPDFPPFAKRETNELELSAAHSSVLALNDMAPRRL